MVPNKQFWQGKRVLITGHTGFKGAWLSFWLSELGAEVHGIALAPSTEPNAFTALALAKRCQHHEIDIRNRQKLKATIASIDPEICFHMAAQALVRESYKTPMETYETNVIGTGNVLMALKECAAIRSIVVITTDKCYENREWHWGYRETDALGGFDPYSSSKACAEILTASFRRSFFATGSASSPTASTSSPAATAHAIGLASVRAGNVIGGGDWSADRLIPDIVRNYRDDSQLEIRYPGAIRPWQHVLSPLSGYVWLAEKLFVEPAKWSEAYNFAPQDEDCVPVRVILESFGQAWGKPVVWKQTPGPQAHEAHFLKLDSSKAKAELGWRPRWNLEQALQATVKWYRAYYDSPEKIADLTREQIRNYCGSGLAEKPKERNAE